MAGEIRIVVLHGIGRHSEDFYKELEIGLSRELDSLGVGAYKISGFLFSDISQPNQDRYWESVDPKTISIDRFREVFLHYFGDAGAYGTRHDDRSGNYRKIHVKLEHFLSHELEQLNHEGTLIVLAHSFGGHVFSNFYWDYLKRIIKPRRLRGLSSCFKLFITTGCNIPVFIAGFERPEPFKIPNPDFRWINIYDKDDILGWPLRPLGGGFQNAGFIEDRIVDSGLPFLSHMRYWTNRRSLKIIAEAIAETAARNQIIQLSAPDPSA